MRYLNRNKDKVKQQTHNKPILVLGAGSWGTALALLLFRNGNTVRLWSYDPQQVAQLNTLHENPAYLPGIELPPDLFISNDLEALLDGVDDVLIVVPSCGFSDAVKQLKAIRPEGLRIAWGTKGLDPDTHQMLSDVVREIYHPDVSLAVISGPSFAKEVALLMPTGLSLAGNDDAFNSDLIDRLHSPMFRVYLNPDLIGVELCGVVKNVLAITVGISDGIGLGANARSAIITRGLAEMSRLCSALGGQEQTLMSLTAHAVGRIASGGERGRRGLPI
ncbi:MAG: glycerol-3-phosphate dehydrogenase [Coxiella sp. (in: Bacteria)]|nr:MAG: glycerol-3-phosphate dehydrogenase [Coxiella sp. (in: g-proteobacteria)]